ncbi:MAG: class I mannose-6-phosphate isomerase [Acidobacteriaceae bacterium]|nr:class I mannose-6-phosphate isomerase [Acidobacteriaceae bacterium]MBV9779172.1 class I mannose-6-phosphate isomerase [Acidobacteriaceae bacterium]
MAALALDKPIQLMPIFRERVWGRESLAPYFPITPRNEPIGEVWFTAEENLTSVDRTLGDLIREHPEILGSGADFRYPNICPLLLKLIFTNDRLSVQVHPDDEYAAKHHQSLGKTEAWYILEANPLGKIALGFSEALLRDRLRQAAQSGEIEHLLDWHSVAAGDAVFVPAGTIHAIGEGLIICEIQENSDITYRLYDFGRGRELHLEHAIEVARLDPQTSCGKRVALSYWREELVACSYFRLERLVPKRVIQIDGSLPYYSLLLCVKGSGRVAQEEFTEGQAWLIPAGGASYRFEGTGSEWILAYKSDQPMMAIQGE